MREAQFLTNRQLEDYEYFYHTAKAQPEFYMQNIFNGATSERHCVYDETARILFKQHGRRGAKLNVAIHEAGHAVVYAATRTNIDSAKVFYEKASKGYNGVVRPEGYDPVKALEYE